MRLTLKQLLHLSVETRSGTKLGKVHDIVFETDGQLVAQYVVKPHVISRDEYRIAQSQVVRFEEGKMIVDDTVKKVETPHATPPSPLPGAEPVAMRGQN